MDRLYVTRASLKVFFYVCPVSVWISKMLLLPKLSTMRLWNIKGALFLVQRLAIRVKKIMIKDYHHCFYTIIEFVWFKPLVSFLSETLDVTKLLRYDLTDIHDSFNHSNVTKYLWNAHWPVQPENINYLYGVSSQEISRPMSLKVFRLNIILISF